MVFLEDRKVKIARTISCAALCACGFAAAVDLEAPRTEVHAGSPLLSDTEIELKWDNGTLRAAQCWATAGPWLGNGFDVSTLGQRTVKLFRIYSTGSWPNNRWDGFRIAIYNYTGGVPGSLLWPASGGAFVKGSGYGWLWCDFDVDCTLPKSVTAFVAAFDQIYNRPDCDPHGFDTGAYRGHCWRYYRGSWAPYTPPGNLMLRAVVTGRVGIAPTSLGRVKALYY